MADRNRTALLLLALAIEKVVQHALVTWAFMADRFGLREDVGVDYRWLAAGGAGAGLVFAMGAWGLARRRRGSLGLLQAVAVFDIVGEFVAQGTFAIEVTVSFLVALVILGLAVVLDRQDWPDRGITRRNG